MHRYRRQLRARQASGRPHHRGPRRAEQEQCHPLNLQDLVQRNGLKQTWLRQSCLGLWRLAVAFGFPMGMLNDAGNLAVVRRCPAIFTVAITLLSEAVAPSAFGLVRPWGDVSPPWLPFTGGHPRCVQQRDRFRHTGFCCVALIWTVGFLERPVPSGPVNRPTKCLARRGGSVRPNSGHSPATSFRRSVRNCCSEQLHR